MSLPDFRNEPFTDFTKPENAAAMERALTEVKAQFGRSYPLIIGGEKISTEKTIASINPSTLNVSACTVGDRPKPSSVCVVIGPMLASLTPPNRCA